MRSFDLVVIGSGPAGQRCAVHAAKLGKSVCVVEQREVVGGVAVNTGTIPSKALREAILRALGRGTLVARTSDFGQGKAPSLARLLGSANEVVKGEIDLIRKRFDANGIETITGRGEFRDPFTIDIIGEHAASTVRAERVLIAVGTQPTRMPGIPFDGTNVITSDEILSLPHLPRSMIVVGGGVIGTEYASMLQALGVRVTLVEGRPRVLDFVDTEIAEALQYHLRQAGMTLRLSEKVVKVRCEIPSPHPRTTGENWVEAFLESGKSLHGALTQRGCVECHDIHGGDHKRLLKDEYPSEMYYPFNENNYALCFSCHDRHLVLDQKTSGATGFRNGDTNLHFVHVNRDKKGRSCRICHDAHAASSDKHIRDAVPYGPAGWKLPLKYQSLPDGGSCGGACHAPLEYNRVNPLVYPPRKPGEDWKGEELIPGVRAIPPDNDGAKPEQNAKPKESPKK